MMTVVVVSIIDMAEAIVRALKDAALRQRMGDAGFARVNERFTVERMVAGTARVYARVAAAPHVAGTDPPPTGDSVAR